MRIRITDELMSSDQTRHYAVPVDPAQPYGQWRVSWLDDRTVTRNQAITALALAESVAALREETPTDQQWSLMDAWASELDLARPDALRRCSLSEFRAGSVPAGGDQ